MASAKSATCKPFTVCQADEYQSAAPTSITDRVCFKETDCLPGQYQTTAPSSKTDRMCKPCPVNTYSIITNGTTCTPCPADTSTGGATGQTACVASDPDTPASDGSPTCECGVMYLGDCNQNNNLGAMKTSSLSVCSTPAGAKDLTGKAQQEGVLQVIGENKDFHMKNCCTSTCVNGTTAPNKTNSPILDPLLCTGGSKTPPTTPQMACAKSDSLGIQCYTGVECSNTPPPDITFSGTMPQCKALNKGAISCKGTPTDLDGAPPPLKRSVAGANGGFKCSLLELPEVTLLEDCPNPVCSYSDDAQLAKWKKSCSEQYNNPLCKYFGKKGPLPNFCTLAQPGNTECASTQECQENAHYLNDPEDNSWNVLCTTTPPPTDPSAATCSDGEYSKDGTCTAYTSCSEGEYITGAGTATSDQTCGKMSTCAPGTFATTTPAPTQTTDTVCKPCQAGTFTAEKNLFPACTSFTVCGPNEQATGGSDKADRTCTSLTPCAAGTSSTTGFQPCTPCAEGTFAEGTGSTSCTAWTTCTSDQIMTEGTATSNRTCTDATPCLPGTYSATGNTGGAAACTPCPSGTFAESTSNTSCASCTGITDKDAGATSCSPCPTNVYASTSTESCSCYAYIMPLQTLATTYPYVCPKTRAPA